MGKCFYCNEAASSKVRLCAWNGFELQNEDFYYCSEECKIEIEQFINFVNKNAVKLLVLIVVSVLSFIPFLVLAYKTNNVLFERLLIPVPILLMGILMFFFPVANTATLEMLGIKKSIKLTKILGIFLIIFSPIVFFIR